MDGVGVRHVRPSQGGIPLDLSPLHRRMGLVVKLASGGLVPGASLPYKSRGLKQEAAMRAWRVGTMSAAGLTAKDAAAEPDIGETKRLRARRRDRFISVASPVGLMLTWELAAQLHLIDTRFFPAPSAILAVLFRMAASGELSENVLISLQRLGLGFLLGGIPALVLGIVMGISRPIRALVDPLIAATYPIPKSSILPLILLIFGLGESSKIVMVAIGVFYPVAINATAG